MVKNHMENKTDKVLVFDLKGDYGCFRKKDTSKRTLTHIFSRTSLIGAIGAILGIEKNTYWVDGDLKDIEFAVSYLNPIKTYTITVNHAQTRDGNLVKFDTKNKGSKINTYVFNNLVKDRTEKESTDISLELLENIHYRIFVSNKNNIYYNELKKHLENKTSVYPTYFGHIEYLADIKYLGESEIKNVNENEIQTASILSENYIEKISKDNINSYFMDVNVPISMSYDGKEITYVENDDFLITEKGEKLHCIIKEEFQDKVYRVGDDEIIVMLPNENKKVKKDE